MHFVSSQSFWAQEMLLSEHWELWQVRCLGCAVPSQILYPSPRPGSAWLCVCTVSVGVCLGRDQMLPELEGTNAGKPKSQGTVCSVVWREPHLRRIPTFGIPSPGIPNRSQFAEKCGEVDICSLSTFALRDGMCFGPSQWPWMWQE